MVPLVAALALAASPIRVERDLHYATGPEQVLDAYVVPNARRAVVLNHGGGFHSGSKESPDPTSAARARRGFGRSRRTRSSAPATPRCPSPTRRTSSCHSGRRQ